MSDDVEFVDSENFQNNKETYGFREIAMEQFHRVVVNYSKEFRAGFWIYSEQPMRNPEKIRYVGDSRKELRNSIDCLHDVLLSKFDEDMQKASEEYSEAIGELKKKQDEEKIEDVWKEMWVIYRKLFQEISLFMARLGWLEGQEATDDE